MLTGKLYRKQRAKVRLAGTTSIWFCVLNGVWQPYFLNIISEIVTRETTEGFEGGLQIGGKNIQPKICR